MPDIAIITGDQVQFLPAQGAATLMAPALIPINGSGTLTIMGKPICLEGDEKNVQLPIPYIAGPYIIPGMGLLKITALGGDQLSKKALNGKKMILKGSQFDAEMQVTAPAQQPTPTGPVPDGTPKYTGKGQFISTNIKFTPT
ncbi:hypothetical protein [Spongorhabdus nitratireducens]